MTVNVNEFRYFKISGAIDKKRSCDYLQVNSPFGKAFIGSRDRGCVCLGQCLPLLLRIHSAHLRMRSDFLKTVPTNTKVLSAAYDYLGIVDLGKSCWNPKTKLGVATDFSETIELNV